MKWRRSILAIGCATISLCVTVATLVLASRAGLFVPSHAGPEGVLSAGSCYLSLTKMSDGSVRLSVHQVDGLAVVVQRHGDDWGGIRLEARGALGGWGELDPINSYVHVDTPDQSDADWVSLEPGDEVSWRLLYLTSGRLKAGDQVRLRRKTIGKVPPSLTAYGKPFPDKDIDVILTVKADAR